MVESLIAPDRVITTEYEDHVIVKRVSASVPGCPFSAEGDTELDALKNLCLALARYYTETQNGR